MVNRQFTARTVSPTALLSPQENAFLPTEDRLAIHELIARHCLALDTGDEAHLASIVTEDFRQEHAVFGALEGRSGFAALMRDNPEFLGAIRHQAVNIVAVRTGAGTAKAVHYTIVMQVHAMGAEPPAPLPRLFAHGVVRDQLVKQDGRWLIHRRTYDQMSLTADLFPEDQRREALRRRTPDWEA